MRVGNLIRASFIKRLNRFVGEVHLGGKREKVLIRNTGRMRELLTEGREVYLRAKNSGKLRYELFLVSVGNSLVCINSHIAPSLFMEWAKGRGFPEEVHHVKREPRIGSSRFDLLINSRWLVEVKSVNLVKEGVAMFPDAPTIRGKRHVEELIKLRKAYRPLLVFVILREDAVAFSPNCQTDPGFCEALKKYISTGLDLKILKCDVSPESIIVSDEEVPLIL